VSWYGQHRFLVLLASLVLMFLLDAVVPVEARRGTLAVLYTLILGLTVVATFPPGWGRRVGVTLAAITLIGHWLTFVFSDLPMLVANMADLFGGALFLFYALGMILATVLAARSITIDTISGAVCGYLLLGLGCGWLYALFETLAPGSFFSARADFISWLREDHLRRALLTYYSFVTLSTAGYGDITPLSQLARTLSWAEAVAGQFYMAILVAGLVGIRISQVAGSRQPTTVRESGKTSGSGHLSGE
jgi:hypothetical protein